MRLHILVAFGMMSTFAVGVLQPLSFDQDLSGHSVGSLFKTTANLFYTLHDADLLQESVQIELANCLTDLIGGLYILRYHQQHIHILHDDLVYLANLIHDLKRNFNNITQVVTSGHIQYIARLFEQIDTIFLALI